MTDADRRENAERCLRLARTMTDPELASGLQRLAAEYAGGVKPAVSPPQRLNPPPA
jgi:hypothetical protein